MSQPANEAITVQSWQPPMWLVRAGRVAPRVYARAGDAYVNNKARIAGQPEQIRRLAAAGQSPSPPRA